MSRKIHEIVTDIKFLYPCIAFGEETDQGNTLIITAETYVSRLYPLKMSVTGMESMGEDFWGRETFKDSRNQYYCELDGELYFKGNDIEGEPHYPTEHTINYTYPTIDPEMNAMEPFIEKVKNYISERSDYKLAEVTKSIYEDNEQPSRSKITCMYKLILK